MKPTAAYPLLVFVVTLIAFMSGELVYAQTHSAPRIDKQPQGDCSVWINDNQPTYVCTDGHAWKWQDLGRWTGDPGRMPSR